MRLRLFVVLSLLMASAGAQAQTAPVSAPRTVGVPVTAQGVSAAQPDPAGALLVPASNTGASERVTTSVQAGDSGVTKRVRNANAHDVDAQGHVLDPHGNPVGQKPLPAASVH